MAKDEAYRKAEEKIEAARRSGAKELDLSHGFDAKDSERLTELPESLSQLTQLQSLTLSRNRLRELPEWLARFGQLKLLGLDGNELTALPEWLGQLTQLQSLDVSANRLTSVPKSLGHLTQLNSLNLGNNGLTELPEWMGNVAQLRFLTLSRNQLTTLPDSLGQLTQLAALRVWDNRLASYPECLSTLTSLRVLDLSTNEITSLPDSIGNLKNLEQLILGDQVGGNNLSDLPVSLAWLGLEILKLDANPLNPELAAAYEDGLDAVKRYLRAKASAQTVLNEAKLIVVGEGEVGKSCLLGALRGDDWIEDRDTTHGIEIKPVKVTDPEKGTEITLNGWDFGGQRVYRPTHQLFFSSPAVYLVVWKPREGPQQGFVKDWIKLVKHREPEAKILVVATHGGPKERQPDIDRQEIWDFFGKETVIDFFHVDSQPPELDKKTGRRTGECRGIKELKDAITRVAASLPEMGRTFPKHWQEAREALRRSTEAYLPLDRVFAICKEYKVDEDDARLLLRICHRVGDLIHYEHDPALRNIVVLKPDWLATATRIRCLN